MDILKYLPGYEQKSLFIQGQIAALNKEFVRLWDGLQHVARQFFITTCDETTIQKWEVDYEIGSDSSKTPQERIDAVQAKMEGWGKASVELVTSVADGYVPSGTDFYVVFGFVPRKLFIRVESSFTDSDMMVRVIRGFFPADIDVIAVIGTEHTHEFLSAFTHDHLSGFTHDELAGDTFDLR